MTLIIGGRTALSGSVVTPHCGSAAEVVYVAVLKGNKDMCQNRPFDGRSCREEIVGDEEALLVAELSRVFWSGKVIYCKAYFLLSQATLPRIPRRISDSESGDLAKDCQAVK